MGQRPRKNTVECAFKCDAFSIFFSSINISDENMQHKEDFVQEFAKMYDTMMAERKEFLEKQNQMLNAYKRQRRE